ncbi:hypothetical protein [Rhodococcus sp. OK302]|uniref:hypothetical protein n=1 Tax=Rhodococcus sp. OK302 TaxID=1882769 RepID=UPI000B94319F|nr:hypothetical protein [Rhodococcus sp. OK302]
MTLIVVLALGAFFGINHFRQNNSDSGNYEAAAADKVSSSDASDSSVTRCGSPPTFTPTKIVTDSGALAVTMKITATCPTGDVLASSRTRVSVSASGANVASGYFNFSSTPIFVPRTDTGGQIYTEQILRFPIGAFWRTPESLPSPSASTFVVESEQSGTAGAQSGEFLSRSTSFNATAPAPPATGDAEQASYNALRAIADADRPVVLSQLGEKWVPQISSKRLGLVADGVTWNNTEMLREHLELRLRYPNVKLLWSGEWSVFSSKDFWITVAGVTYSDSADANRWCSTNGLSADHCFAKLISATHPIEGSTASR